ncbi:UBX domain-containing protein [Cavenderia fasciculata]|uniref:UBX domain-containing protein n=1 Tax=Cavenderia fasciculata TaxID=261658 RepID=F4QAX4_CACFS|nr:UBX domain-containing protein [Cavenderia fasciculata]EGG15033.1 UBX domain-containing protein [Cavenderia fasciculata]|eukprot:XP_004351753.1 UBX domain-containing protein [Cavenderia fasciculata]
MSKERIVEVDDKQVDHVKLAHTKMVDDESDRVNKLIESYEKLQGKSQQEKNNRKYIYTEGRTISGDEHLQENMERWKSDREILREMQDMEYEESLAKDKKLQQRKQEIIIDKEKEVQERQNRIQWLKDNLRPEPIAAAAAADMVVGENGSSSSFSSASSNISTIQIKLPSGATLKRRYLLSDTIQDIIDFVDSKEVVQKPRYYLATNIPKQQFRDTTVTIQDAQLYPQVSVYVIEE